jgi:hypothetical protein
LIVTWNNYQTAVEGRPALVLLDDRFATEHPTDFECLAWFGVYSQLDPGASYWNPEEGMALDAIEANLLRLCERVSHGEAIYLRRVDTRGVREYYFYFPQRAALAGALPQLLILHPGYRLEYEQKSDPNWKHYSQWLRETPAA